MDSVVAAAVALVVGMGSGSVKLVLDMGAMHVSDPSMEDGTAVPLFE